MSEDREEGEIVDDDLEDISDNSISTLSCAYPGKSVSSKDHLPAAISLSSLTEIDELPNEKKKLRCRAKPLRRKSFRVHRRKSYQKHPRSDSDSDECLMLDRRLKKQLKATVHFEQEGCHKNSLRSRLREMTKLDKGSNDEPKDDVKVSSDDGDNELIELRCEALRTAVLNKFKHRKKRKAVEVLENDPLTEISNEINKENSHNSKNQIEDKPPHKKICFEQLENKMDLPNNNVNSPEDDEDVLRALLLASMSKKITRVVETKMAAPIIDNCKKQVHHLKLSNENSNTTVNNVNRIVHKTYLKAHPIQHPKVKPIIINVNSGSDSEDNSVPNNVMKVTTDLREIESSVEKFLKEERAKVEAQLSPIPKVVPVKRNHSTILEKSSVKLLPKIKQIEYQKLLQKLKNAEKKRRVRRVSHRNNGEAKLNDNNTKKLIRHKLPVTTKINTTHLNQVPNYLKNNKSKLPVTTKINTRLDHVPDIKNEAKILHAALKEMQTQKNGRLQIQEKYVVLTPIIRKINEASVDRKKYDQEVKRLIEELKEARKRLFQTHRNITSHVKELITKKQDIDQSSRKSINASSEKPVTSTPIRDTPPAGSVDKGSIATSTNRLHYLHTKPINAVDICKDTNKSDKISDAVAICKDTDKSDHISGKTGDPAEVVGHCVNQLNQKNNILKYISPLDVKRDNIDDPFSIMCPYDVDGNCRDPECIYKHYCNKVV